MYPHINTFYASSIGATSIGHCVTRLYLRGSEGLYIVIEEVIYDKLPLQITNYLSENVNQILFLILQMESPPKSPIFALQ